jgi:hypothetical protein
LKKIYKKRRRKRGERKRRYFKGIYSGEKCHALEAKNSAFQEMNKKDFWL